MEKEELVQANSGAPALSEKVNSAAEKRPYDVFEIAWRLSGIRSTVRKLTSNGELSDYDDEMATDLVIAMEFSEQLLAYAKALQSIATNTCCDGCREAALVARAALTQAGVNFSNEPERTDVSLNQPSLPESK